jgi:hypothetical protein
MLRGLSCTPQILRMPVMSRSVSFRQTHIEPNPIPIPEHLDIRLTDVESQLCVLLDDCTTHLAGKDIHTACRIAGGWVRDKVGEVLLWLSNGPSTTCSF